MASTLADDILHVLARSEEPVSAKDVVNGVLAMTDTTEGSVRSELSKLKKRGDVISPRYGTYTLPARESGDEMTAVQKEADVMTLPVEVTGAGDPADDANGAIVVSRRQLRSALGYAPADDNAFAIKIQGTSMEPWLRDGQIVICLRADAVEAPGRYVFWSGDGGYQVKDIERAGDEALRITQHGPNPRTEILEHIEEDEYRGEAGRTHTIKIKGRVVYPDDTARAVLRQVTSELRKIMGEK